MGHLKYSHSSWLDDSLIVGGLCAGAFLVVLLIVVPVCVWCCRKRQRKTKESQESLYGHHERSQGMFKVPEVRVRKPVVFRQDPTSFKRLQDQGYLTTAPPEGGYMAPVAKPGSYISAASDGGKHRPVYLTNPATRLDTRSSYKSPSYLAPVDQ